MPEAGLLRMIIPVLVALLAGCNPFTDARPMMDEYVERVARVLEAEPQLSDLASASQLPRRRDRVLAMPDLDMGMLDFLSLYGCELQYVVGEKNSVLGRVMQPLNRLRYEIRFIEAARDCLPGIKDEGLAEELGEAVQSKLESLPIAVWNATWGWKKSKTCFPWPRAITRLHRQETRSLIWRSTLTGSMLRLPGCFPAICRCHWILPVRFISAGRQSTARASSSTAHSC